MAYFFIIAFHLLLWPNWWEKTYYPFYVNSLEYQIIKTWLNIINWWLGSGQTVRDYSGSPDCCLAECLQKTLNICVDNNCCRWYIKHPRHSLLLCLSWSIFLYFMPVHQYKYLVLLTETSKLYPVLLILLIKMWSGCFHI